MTIGSLFDGIGGFPLGASRHGIAPMWASEIEPFPIKVTQIRFPEMVHVGDITKLNGAELPTVDIISGGSPCQDLSAAGKRAGLEGARSGLFMDMVRLIKEMRNGTGKPRFMVWENVPGAFSSNDGDDFRAVLEETARVAEPGVSIPRPPEVSWQPAGCILADGYSIAWRTFDAQYWGVPQRRRRIYLVADFGGHTAPEILFVREGLHRDIAEGGEAREGVAGDVETGVACAGFRNGNSAQSRNIGWEENLAPTIPAESGGNKACVVTSAMYENHGQDSRLTGPLDVSPTVSQKYGTGGNNTPLVAATLDASYETKWGLEDQHVNAGCPNFIKTPHTVRRLTPLECERLQGFPDFWTDIPGASDSARYKALGNSVAIPCVEYVMQGLAETERGSV